MVARTAREILRWLEGLYLTYPIVVPKWDLSNGFAYAEILHAYFPHEINMFAFINGRSLNARLSNWSLIKLFLSKKTLPISKDLIEATIHGKDDGAEGLLEQTYQVLTNKKAFADPSYERTKDFTDHSYQQNLNHFQRAHASKSIKNNLKISELMTDPCYAYQAKRSAHLVSQSKLDRQNTRLDFPERFDIKPSLAERCLRKPIRSNSNAQDWFNKSFESRSRSATTKSNSFRQPSQQSSIDPRKKSSLSRKTDDGTIEVNNDDGIYREIILRQHAVPFSDFLQMNDS